MPRGGKKKSEPRNPTQRAWAPAHIRTCERGRPFPSRVFSSSSWVWGGEGNLPAEDQEEKRRFCRLLAPASPGLVKGNNSDRKSSQIKWDFYTIIFHGVCKTDLRECNTKSNRNKIISCVYSNEFSTQKSNVTHTALACGGLPVSRQDPSFRRAPHVVSCIVSTILKFLLSLNSRLYIATLNWALDMRQPLSVTCNKGLTCVLCDSQRWNKTNAQGGGRNRYQLNIRKSSVSLF